MRRSAFHRRVRLRLRLLGMRPADLVRAWGRAPSRVHDLLEQDVWPGGEDLLSLPRALRCNPMWLFYGKGDPDEMPGQGFADGVRHERARILRAIEDGK